MSEFEATVVASGSSQGTEGPAEQLSKHSIIRIDGAMRWKPSVSNEPSQLQELDQNQIFIRQALLRDVKSLAHAWTREITNAGGHVLDAAPPVQRNRQVICYLDRVSYQCKGSGMFARILNMGTTTYEAALTLPSMDSHHFERVTTADDATKAKDALADPREVRLFESCFGISRGGGTVGTYLEDGSLRESCGKIDLLLAYGGQALNLQAADIAFRSGCHMRSRPRSRLAALRCRFGHDQSWSIRQGHGGRFHRLTVRRRRAQPEQFGTGLAGPPNRRM